MDASTTATSISGTSSPCPRTGPEACGISTPRRSPIVASSAARTATDARPAPDRVETGRCCDRSGPREIPGLGVHCAERRPLGVVVPRVSPLVQLHDFAEPHRGQHLGQSCRRQGARDSKRPVVGLSLIHISEPTRLGMISYAVFCLK